MSPSLSIFLSKLSFINVFAVVKVFKSIVTLDNSLKEEKNKGKRILNIIRLEMGKLSAAINILVRI